MGIMGCSEALANLTQASMDQVPGSCQYSTWSIKESMDKVCARPLTLELTFVYRYYVLIAACVFARRAEWLRNACLAAALLFPAVAAIHGIVYV
jgi:hypothetical protein